MWQWWLGVSYDEITLAVGRGPVPRQEATGVGGARRPPAGPRASRRPAARRRDARFLSRWKRAACARAAALAISPVLHSAWGKGDTRGNRLAHFCSRVKAAASLGSVVLFSPTKSSKPAGRGSPTLGWFDSIAAPSGAMNGRKRCIVGVSLYSPQGSVRQKSRVGCSRAARG
jgi:hypothetical protein